MNSQKIVFVVGPTAVGKSRIAFLLAKKIKGAIVSCDAMQVYKEVSVINNKPPKVFLNTVEHHLIGEVSIAQDFDVAAFRKKALRAIKKIHAHDKIPIVTGGSGLYMKVLLDGIFEGAAKNPAVRQSLECEAEEKGIEALYKRLCSVDPKAASKIHPHDQKRIIRALEVFLVSQKPISELQKNRRGLWGCFDIKIFTLNRKREELYALINKRVDTMFEEGAVEEIKGLLNKKWSRTAESIIGAAEIKKFFRGEYNINEVKEAVKLKTRRYAKRQLTWFRHEERLRWVTISADDTPFKIVAKIMEELKSHG